jgi:hypothetical protein
MPVACPLVVRRVERSRSSFFMFTAEHRMQPSENGCRERRTRKKPDSYSGVKASALGVNRQMALMEDWLIPVGVLCLSAAILTDRFLMMEARALSFVVGMLTGVAMALNLVGLCRMGKSKR